MVHCLQQLLLLQQLLQLLELFLLFRGQFAELEQQGFPFPLQLLFHFRLTLVLNWLWICLLLLHLLRWLYRRWMFFDCGGGGGCLWMWCRGSFSGCCGSCCRSWFLHFNLFHHRMSVSMVSLRMSLSLFLSSIVPVHNGIMVVVVACVMRILSDNLLHWFLCSSCPLCP